MADQSETLRQGSIVDTCGTKLRINEKPRSLFPANTLKRLTSEHFPLDSTNPSFKKKHWQDVTQSRFVNRILVWTQSFPSPKLFAISKLKIPVCPECKLLVLDGNTWNYTTVCKLFLWDKNSKVKLATIVEGNPKVPFSIATTPRCRGALLLSLECSTLPLILIL